LDGTLEALDCNVARIINCFFQFRGAASTDRPGMSRKASACSVSHAHLFPLESRLINVISNLPPDHRVCGIIRDTGFPTNATQSEVHTTCVDHVCEISMAQVILDELLAEGPLHEGIRDDHAHPAGWLFTGIVASDRQIEEAFRERNT
jgi:hypothetical protein